MIVLGIIILYLLIGILIGRRSFVKRMGDNPRFNPHNKDEFSDAYSAAIGWGIWHLLFWPIVFPMWIITQVPTPDEKLKKKEKELAERERVLEQWAKSAGQITPDEILFK